MDKVITFDGITYTVPEWVKWVVRHANGTIKGYQYEPFHAPIGLEEYEQFYGMEHTIYKPKVMKVAV